MLKSSLFPPSLPDSFLPSLLPSSLSLFYLFVVCFETDSICSQGWPRTYDVAQASLTLMPVLLHQPPKCWYYRREPLHSIFVTDLLWGHCWELVLRIPAVFPSSSSKSDFCVLGSWCLVNLFVVVPTSWWVDSLMNTQSSALSFTWRESGQKFNTRTWSRSHGGRLLMGLLCDSCLVSFLPQLTPAYLPSCHHSGPDPSVSISKQGRTPWAGQCDPASSSTEVFSFQERLYAVSIWQ